MGRDYVNTVVINNKYAMDLMERKSAGLEMFGSIVY